MLKFLNFITWLCKLLGFAAMFNKVPGVEPGLGVKILAGSLIFKHFLIELGDMLDDGQINGSFNPDKLQQKLPGIGAAIALCCVLFFASGCVAYRDPSGQTLTAFMQKSTFEGLAVNPKTGLRVKSAEVSGDAEMFRAIFDAGVATGKAAGKAAGVP